MGIQLSPKAALAAGTFLGAFRSRLTAKGMAMDAAADLFEPIFAGVTSKNYAAQRPALDAALRATLRGRLASDADLGEVSELLQAIEGIEGGADTVTEANAGLPPHVMEDPEDADDETPEERDEDEACDRRARDAKMRLGRDASEEEIERLEEEEDPPEGRRSEAEDRARDAMRMRRAADARKLLGRDETEEETKKREEKDDAEDRKRAHDRRRMGRDYRRARDAHRTARDAHRRAAADWRKAHDGHAKAMDAKSAEDAARHARDMKKADDECKEAMDAMVKARDSRHEARDARRAHDKRYGRDDPPEFKGMPKPGGEMVTKEAMDAAISERVNDALRENDRKHREISEARVAVRPKAGDIAMDSAISSAGDVYARALDVLGVDHVGVRDAIALRKMFEIAPRRGGDPQRGNGGFAHDAAPSATAYQSFAQRFPNAAKIEHA